MESSHSTTAQSPGRKPFKIPIVFAPIYIPLLFLAAAVSIPWAYIQKSLQRRKERRFMEQMKNTGRLMEWQEFKQAEASGGGTAIGEYLSIPKGPFRLWWTTEDIQGTTPHKWPQEMTEGWLDSEFQPFFKWCYLRYTNAECGLARLVRVPEEQKRELRKTLADVRYVSIDSFHPRREEKLHEIRS